VELIAEIQNLKKSFGTNAVLKNLSFTIHKGENLVVFGRSGSGKSVLIKCMVGLVTPDEGKVELIGENVLELKDEAMNVLRKKIGFLFQGAALYDSMTVRENLEFPLRDLQTKPKAEIEELVNEALENVGLIEAIDKMPSELSGGMRKRIGLARAIILKPEIILYDEPTTGLDTITSKEISQLILNIQKKYDTSSIIITHDIECARMTADKMIVLKDGTCAASGTFKELSESKDTEINVFFK
jgi:phospholipid/cholesterol/gamma-HCH transport system ATP-binding protein